MIKIKSEKKKNVNVKKKKKNWGFLGRHAFANFVSLFPSKVAIRILLMKTYVPYVQRTLTSSS